MSLSALVFPGLLPCLCALQKIPYSLLGEVIFLHRRQVIWFQDSCMYKSRESASGAVAKLPVSLLSSRVCLGPTRFKTWHAAQALTP